MPIRERIVGPARFSRLSYTHALSTCADAFFAVSLAGSLFFNVSVNAARPRIVFYLLVTLAPFAILAPFVGPLIDRFGRARPVVVSLTCLARGILCLFIAGDLRNLLLYPEVFGLLVLEKAYSVTKSAIVPGLVEDDGDLVAANSRLSRISMVAGLGGGGIAAGILVVGDAVPVLRVASLVYFAAAAVALRIAPDDPARLPPGELEREELHAPTIQAAAAAMALLRGAVGFLTFLVAFGLKRAGEPAWVFGLVAASAVIGGLVGATTSPFLRQWIRRDEPLLAGGLLVAAAVALAAGAVGGLVAECVVVFAIALAANIARQGFDSILQRDAPDAARGRSFARFETVFQLVWVFGALIAVVAQPRVGVGLAVLGLTLAVGVVGYVIAFRRNQTPGSWFGRSRGSSA